MSRRRESAEVESIQIENVDGGALVLTEDLRLFITGDRKILALAALSALAGEELIDVYATTQTLIRGTEFPALAEEEVTDDGETYMALRCPVCEHLVDDGNLFAISPAEHWAPNDYPGDDAFDHGRVTFDSSDRPDLEETLYYSHGDSPGHPVTLPSGWSEDWT